MLTNDPGIIYLTQLANGDEYEDISEDFLYMLLVDDISDPQFPWLTITPTKAPDDGYFVQAYKEPHSYHIERRLGIDSDIQFRKIEKVEEAHAILWKWLLKMLDTATAATPPI